MKDKLIKLIKAFGVSIESTVSSNSAYITYKIKCPGFQIFYAPEVGYLEIAYKDEIISSDELKLEMSEEDIQEVKNVIVSTHLEEADKKMMDKINRFKEQLSTAVDIIESSGNC